MSNDAENRVNEVEHIMAGLGWDRGAMSLAHEIRKFLLTSVADQGTGIDSGGSDDNADLWVKVGGVEYYIHIRHSNAQIASTVEPLPEPPEAP